MMAAAAAPVMQQSIADQTEPVENKKKKTVKAAAVV
jgi:hypothetical protein